MPVSALKMRKSKMAKNGPFLKLCSSFLKYGSNALHSPKIGDSLFNKKHVHVFDMFISVGKALNTKQQIHLVQDSQQVWFYLKTLFNTVSFFYCGR